MLLEMWNMPPDDKIARNKVIALNDPSLLKQKCCLNGGWIDADDGATIDVINPATGATLGTVPKIGAAETRAPSRPPIRVACVAREDREGARGRSCAAGTT